MEISIIAKSEEQAKMNAKAILKNEGCRNIEILGVSESPFCFEGLNGNVYSVQYKGLYHEQEQINIELLRKERNDILKLQKQLKKLSEQKMVLNKKIEKITRKCDHRVVVETRNELSDNDNYVIEEVRCLLCNKQFSSLYEVNFDEKFENRIHLESVDATSSEKTELAFNMFCDIKEQNPELSDSEIVELINNKPKQKVKK